MKKLQKILVRVLAAALVVMLSGGAAWAQEDGKAALYEQLCTLLGEPTRSEREEYGVLIEDIDFENVTVEKAAAALKLLADGQRKGLISDRNVTYDSMQGVLRVDGWSMQERLNMTLVYTELYHLLGRPTVENDRMIFSGVTLEKVSEALSLLADAQAVGLIGEVTTEYYAQSGRLTVGNWFVGTEAAELGICVLTGQKNGEDDARLAGALLDGIWNEGRDWLEVSVGYEWMDAAQADRAAELIFTGAAQVLICDAQTARRYAQNGARYIAVSELYEEDELAIRAVDVFEWVHPEEISDEEWAAQEVTMYDLQDQEAMMMQALRIKYLIARDRMFLKLDPEAAIYCGFDLSHGAFFAGDDMGMYVLSEDADAEAVWELYAYFISH